MFGTRKAEDEIRIDICKSFGIKKISKLIVSGNKLTNKFAFLVASGLGPELARGPPVHYVPVDCRHNVSYFRCLGLFCQLIQC